jgi:hypothetical protein
MPVIYTREYRMGSHNAVNIRIPQPDLALICAGYTVMGMRLEGSDKWYYVMSISTFKQVIDLAGIDRKAGSHGTQI